MKKAMTVKEIIDLTETKFVSLNEEVSDDGSTRLDIIKSNYKENKYSKADELYLREYDKILNTLLEDTKVLKYRFAGDGMTLEAVGNILGLTRERVRQIEEKEFETIKVILAINGYTQNPYSEVQEINNEL